MNIERLVSLLSRLRQMKRFKRTYKRELNNCQLAKVAKSTSQVDALFIDQLAEAVLILMRRVTY